MLPDSAGNAVLTQYGSEIAALNWTPSASTTYGVWLQVELATPSDVHASRHAIDPKGDIRCEAVSDYDLIQTTSYTTSGAVTAIHAATADKSYIFIGTVETDGDTVATISQRDYGPLYVPTIHYLQNTISTDTYNILELGGDAGLFVNGSELRATGTQP